MFSFCKNAKNHDFGRIRPNFGKTEIRQNCGRNSAEVDQKRPNFGTKNGHKVTVKTSFEAGISPIHRAHS